MINRVINEVKKVIVGKDEIIELVLTAILAKGHILMEDIPGVGKTTMALTFSKAMKLNGKRMQFTSDVMPLDITGFSVYNNKKDSLEYKEGAIMCNMFLADEINRTSPKTQSALLEAMEEGSVTVDGITHNIDKPFVVIATQNPIDSIGTQELPDSQLDRFMIKLSMGYPSPDSELIMLKGKEELPEIESVITAENLIELQEKVQNIYVDDKIKKYIIKIANLTRNNEYIKLGLSPRATIAITSMAKANAFLENRKYVIPEDVQKVFPYTAGHRIVLQTRARIEEKSVEKIMNEIIMEVGEVDLS